MARLDETRLDGVIEAVFSQELDDRAWLNQVLCGLAALCRSEHHQYLGFFYDASDACALKVWNVCAATGSDELGAAFSLCHHSLGADFATTTLRVSHVSSARRTHMPDVGPMLRLLERGGWGDIVGINGLDASGSGCFLMIACRDDELDPSPAELFVYRCVAANLAAAFRCRRVRASSCTDIARERVRSSAQAVTPRANPDRNAEWAALSSSLRAASARLTLVDTFEESGQRYVVAQESAVGGVATLTGRERQIVARAMLGYTNKQIAYDLGISDATVRVLMARAAGRLGVRTRRELLAHPSLEQLILNTGESAPFRASEEACELPASSPLS